MGSFVSMRCYSRFQPVSSFGPSFPVRFHFWTFVSISVSRGQASFPLHTPKGLPWKREWWTSCCVPTRPCLL